MQRDCSQETETEHQTRESRDPRGGIAQTTAGAVCQVGFLALKNKTTPCLIEGPERRQYKRSKVEVVGRQGATRTQSADTARRENGKFPLETTKFRQLNSC